MTEVLVGGALVSLCVRPSRAAVALAGFDQLLKRSLGGKEDRRGGAQKRGGEERRLCAPRLASPPPQCSLNTVGKCLPACCPVVDGRRGVPDSSRCNPTEPLLWSSEIRIITPLLQIR